MTSVCFYFQVHQPRRIKRYRIFDVGQDHEYFNDSSETNLNNERIIHKVGNKCYLPANEVIYGLLQKYPEFKVSYSFSGIFLEQLEQYAPRVLDSFKRIIDTGRAEVLSETYYHSLSFLYSDREYRDQIAMHRDKVFDLFGAWPGVLRNTELIFSDELAKRAEQMGFRGILAEGADHILGSRSPNFLYRPEGTERIKLLLKNYRLSDDIAFRFGEKSWKEFPLTAPKFAQWVSAINGNGNVVNLFMDYETFGEHQWSETGIFDFMRALPGEVLKHPDNNFLMVSEAINRYEPVSSLSFPHLVSWADTERDLSAWRSNPMQHDALGKVYALEKSIKLTKNKRLLEDWRRLQTSDHYYYMCTKWFSDGDVHKYFNPYESPYDAFISFMNVLSDVELRLNAEPKRRSLWSILASF